MDRPVPDREMEDNIEQADAGAQAQDVASEALVRSTDLSQDSERGGRPNPAQIIPDDTEDLVEKMEAMNRSGHVDLDAYAGEPQMDDEEDILGATEDLDDDEDGLEDLSKEDDEDDYDGEEADDILGDTDDVEDQNDLA